MYVLHIATVHLSGEYFTAAGICTYGYCAQIMPKYGSIILLKPTDSYCVQFYVGTLWQGLPVISKGEAFKPIIESC